MSTLNTPTPWAQHENEPRVIVAAAAPTMSLLGLDSDDTAVVWSAEDAALIVHRINVHDDLLAALKDCLAHMSGGEKSCGHQFECVCVGKNAVAAIARAEPRKVMTRKEHA